MLIGPGDDAAVLRVRTGHVVVSTDLLVEGRHFRRDWASAEDVGHRAAAQNISDINAMGGRAHSLTIGLAAPPDLPVAWALDFARGFADECATVGASVVGGDLTGASEIVIAVTVIGACTQAPVVRSGAVVGDVLAIAGRQGWAAGGLAVLGRGFRSPRALVEAYRRPAPPYDAGPAAADAGATSMIDISDGLLAEVGHLAADSGVAIDVRRGRLRPARAPPRRRRGTQHRPGLAGPQRRRGPLAARDVPGRARRCPRGGRRSARSTAAGCPARSRSTGRRTTGRRGGRTSDGGGSFSA